jgi:uncharacterized protein (TIRG00374 family)
VTEAPEPALPVRLAPRRSWPWVVALVGFGALGIYLAAPRPGELRAAWHRLGEVPVTAVAIIVGGALGLVVTEAIRIAVIARLAGARVGARDAWDAAVGNHVMTAITPQVGLGEPTVAYILHERGMPWDAAVAVPFVKFTTSLALAFGLGAAIVAAGYGPPVDGAIRSVAVVWFGAVSAISAAVVVIASRPPSARRVVAGLAGWLRRRRMLRGAAWQRRITSAADVALGTVDRLAGVRRTSWRGAAILVVVHLVYYASYIAPLVGLALVLDDPPVVAITLRAMAYLCFVFAMPTPGGAGPSEAAAAVMFGDLLGPADAIIVVAVFRAATFYLQLAIGAVYLPLRSLARSRKP